MKLNKHLLTEIKDIIAHSREQAVRAVDNARVLMYWHIGERVFEEGQQVKDRGHD